MFIEREETENIKYDEDNEDFKYLIEGNRSYLIKYNN